MRIELGCSKCALDGPIENIFPWHSELAEIREDGRYEFTCRHGHHSIIFLKLQKFELLFELGAYAILDGYYRDAVASFTASLERCYEYFIRAKLLQDEVSAQDVENAWKQVSAQSERQLGAFIFLYVQTLKCQPELLSSNKISFRNDVIHKGKIPIREQAVEYGQAVLELIRTIVRAVKSFPNGLKALEDIFLAKVRENNPKEDKENRITYFNPSTIIGLNVESDHFHRRPLSEALEILKCSRKRWRLDP